MTTRLAAAALGLAAVVGLASAQPPGTYSKAAPPDKAVLDRLNLKAEWTQYLPVEGTRDALTQIQTIDDQVFVQTRGGLLVAVDANTGRTQWAARLGEVSNAANAYPVAANSQFVFAAAVTKLYGFYRYTGAVEFIADLDTVGLRQTGGTLSVGLAADERAVFAVLGSSRVSVFDLPRPIAVAAPAAKGGPGDPLQQGAKAAATGAVDDLLKRYNPGAYGAPPAGLPESVARPNVGAPPLVGMTGSKTPSLQAVPRVVPPYALDNRAPAPSLNSVGSLQQPYRMRTDASRYIQQTPSLSTIPPSVAAALALTDLRAKGVSPPLRWEYGLNSRVIYPLVLTPTRVWAMTEGNVAVALNKLSAAGAVSVEVSERLTAAIAAAPAASGLTHYLPLGNGTLLAVDAAGGNLSGGAIVKWRAVVGGINNHTPFVARNFVYASGDDGGVVCVHRLDGPYTDVKAAPMPKGDMPKADAPKEGDAPKAPDEASPFEARPREFLAGDVVWRSDDSADRVIGANDEFVYVRDRQGRFLVFDARRATDPARKRSAPLGSANFAEFNVNVVNTASDRVYLAADNGLLVCLRDANPKYVRPVRLAPPADVNPASRIGVQGGEVKKDDEPKKDPEPKKEP